MSYSTILFCVLLHISCTVAATIIRDASDNSKPLCFDDYGCYVPRPGYRTYPQSPEKVNTKFFLYNRMRLTGPELISAVNLGAFNPAKPIKVIIHGFLDQASNKWVVNMANELLVAEDVNVIAVDWSGGNQFPYNQAAANTVIAAAATRLLLQAMIKKGAKAEQIHLIGHSLGAHISSYIGRGLPNLGRISGLDPAGPDFYTSGAADRLDKSDALFVDVIHTDGAPHLIAGFGHLDVLGHVDFYPNGGSVQPTCGSNTGAAVWQSLGSLVGTMNINNAVDTFSCNHLSALFYFTDSINTRSPAFAYPCADYKSFSEGLCTSCNSKGRPCQPMGYHASPSNTLGTLYLKTLHGVKPPHFGYHFKVILESDPSNAQQTRGNFQIKFNQKGEEIPLFDQNTSLKRDLSPSGVILTENNPMPASEISVSFRKSLDQLFGIGFADQWSFRTITFLDMQSNASYKYCPKSSSSAMIKNGSSVTYQRCN